MSATSIIISETEEEETETKTHFTPAKGIFGKYRGKFNKYHVTLVVFVIIFFFMGDNTLVHRYQYNIKIRELQSEIQLYRQKIEATQAKLSSLQLDTESLERYAREQYLMTEPNEELYIITP